MFTRIILFTPKIYCPFLFIDEAQVVCFHPISKKKDAQESHMTLLPDTVIKDGSGSSIQVFRLQAQHGATSTDTYEERAAGVHCHLTAKEAFLSKCLLMMVSSALPLHTPS